MTQLPGDNNADGKVNMADVTAGLASGSFARAVESIVNFGAESPPVYIVPLQPYIHEARFEALAFSASPISEVVTPGVSAIATFSANRLVCYIEVEDAAKATGPICVSNAAGRYELCEMPEQLETEYDLDGEPWANGAKSKPCNHVIVRNAIIGTGEPLTPKVKPWGGDRRSRSIWFIGCKFIGYGTEPVPVAAADDWGGGIWFHGCEWENCRTTPANARAFVDCDLYDMTSEGFHNARAVYNSTINGIRKTDPTVHPDGIQLSPPTDPGPCCYFMVRGDRLRAQALFIRCPAVRAVGLASILMECDPDTGYKSQVIGPAIDDLVIDGVRITKQPFTIRNDPNSEPPRFVRVKRSSVRGLEAPYGVSVDPSSGVIVQA